MSSRRLKIAAHDHYRESLAYLRVLIQAGHELVDDAPADVFLIDLDPPLAGYQKIIGKHKDAGAKVVLYPHGAGGPILSYDGLWEPDPRVDANLVMGPGQAEFLRRIEYPAPVHAIGWSFCEMRPFRPCDEVRRVVFAPTHPNADGSMADFNRERNADVYGRLLEGPWQLTVRHIGSLEENALWRADGVEYIDGGLVAETTEIDTADAVVAGSGTFPALAIARGVPTVMYAQLKTSLGLPGDSAAPLPRAHRYADYVRYPFDAEDASLEDLFAAVCRSDDGIAHWKRRFIGEPLDPRAFVASIESIANDHQVPAALDETRTFTTLAFVDELIEHPDLLRAYADCFGPQDDASLILWTPGAGSARLLELAEQAIAVAGLPDDRIPDVLLTPMPGAPEADAQLAKRADAVLSRWPAAGRIGSVRRYGAEDAEALAAAAAKRHARAAAG